MSAPHLAAAENRAAVRKWQRLLQAEPVLLRARSSGQERPPHSYPIGRAP
jgi:hypothetical protein